VEVGATRFQTTLSAFREGAGESLEERKDGFERFSGDTIAGMR
jgi:hypothetical protein